MPDYDLMDKTELTIRGIALRDADLSRLADAVAQVLGIERSDLLVTDVLGDQVVIDVLRRGLDPHALVGKKEELRRRLAEVPGVDCTDETEFFSKGMLSWIALEPAEGELILRRSEAMAREIRERLRTTATVFSTGAEVVGGLVKDTNAPFLRTRLEAAGFRVKLGGALKDDEVLIAERLRQAADEGCGLILTTGGVGAEDKDRTIEAVLGADPSAATPHIVKYQLGVGRHRHKDQVRVAVGNVGRTLVVALPGPNDEVQVGVEALVEGLAAGAGKAALAERIAVALRERLREKAAAAGRPGGEG
ncbi:MAG TPA: molybdopterin-binding protein [Anaeromyxobacteraceae bacterium]|nr:molybdopterin-binding protein [Anaeromyxobacteraceae bacterium]